MMTEAQLQKRPNIYGYTDSLLFLNDMVKFHKAYTKVFSYRYFAKKAGFSSQSTLRFLLSGKRNITQKSIPKLCKGLKLSGLESTYFEHLVLFNQATELEEQNFHYAKIQQIQKRKNIKLISSDYYEYFSNWYHPAVRTLVCTKALKGDPKLISKALHPEVPVREVKKSIELLIRLGLLKQSSDGSLEMSDVSISTDREILSMVARNYHKEMGMRAIESLDSVPMELRDISAVTFGIPKEKVQMLKDRIVEFRKEITSSLVSGDDEAEVVYQLNFQLFPLSKGEIKNEKK